MRKLYAKRLGALLCCFVLMTAVMLEIGGSIPTLSASAVTLQELQKEQAEIKKQKDQANANLKALEKDINKQAEYQEELTNKIALNREEMQNLEYQVTLLEHDIADQELLIEEREGLIEEKRTEIDGAYDDFKRRINAMYKAGEASALEMLFSSESFADFFTTIQLMQAVSKHDEAMVIELKQKKSSLEYEVTQLEGYVDELEADKAELNGKIDEIDAIQTELQEAYSASKTAMQDLDVLKARYKNDLESVKEKEEAIEAELQEWYRQQYANSNQGTLTDTVFVWPLPGYSYISSGYGMRWGAMHRGIDITGGGCYGANIVASNSGTVITSDWHYSYGYYVIVDHGGGYSTLYAHASQLLVKVGDIVAKGQPIALVGSTGNSTGPHLHFEVRINGTANNPLNFVSY